MEDSAFWNFIQALLFFLLHQYPFSARQLSRCMWVLSQQPCRLRQGAAPDRTPAVDLMVVLLTRVTQPEPFWSLTPSEMAVIIWSLDSASMQHMCALHAGRMRIGFGTLTHWLTFRLIHSQDKVRATDVVHAVWGLAQVGMTNPAVLGTLVHRLTTKDWTNLSALETVMLLSGCATANRVWVSLHRLSWDMFLEKRNRVDVVSTSARFGDQSIDCACRTARKHLHCQPRRRRSAEHIFLGMPP